MLLASGSVMAIRGGPAARSEHQARDQLGDVRRAVPSGLQRHPGRDRSRGRPPGLAGVVRSRVEPQFMVAPIGAQRGGASERGSMPVLPLAALDQRVRELGRPSRPRCTPVVNKTTRRTPAPGGLHAAAPWPGCSPRTTLQLGGAVTVSSDWSLDRACTAHQRVQPRRSVARRGLSSSRAGTGAAGSARSAGAQAEPGRRGSPAAPRLLVVVGRPAGAVPTVQPSAASRRATVHPIPARRADPGHQRAARHGQVSSTPGLRMPVGSSVVLDRPHRRPARPATGSGAARASWPGRSRARR